MKLKEVQFLYYLINFIFENSQEKNLEKPMLVVECNGKIISADFLSFTDSQRIPALKWLDVDFDPKNKEIEFDFFANFLNLNIRQLMMWTHNSRRLLENPKFLLNELSDFVMDYSKDMLIPDLPNLVENIQYLESGLKLDFAMLPSETYQVISLNIDTLKA